MSGKCRQQITTGPVLRVNRKALTVAIALCLPSLPALADNQIRLALDDVITNRAEEAATTSSSDERIAVHGLIQSHPDPLMAQLEKRYQALPPFTETTEETPEQYIAEASVREKLTNGVSRFMPRIRSSIHYEDGSSSTGSPQGTPTGRNSYTNAIAAVNPTFEYQQPISNWRLQAIYDYERKQYFIDSTEATSNHNANLNFTRKLRRGNELTVNPRIIRTHDRTSNDPIDESRDTTEADFLHTTYALNFAYKQGTLKDRSRLQLNSFNERSVLDVSDPVRDWKLTRHGVNAKYTYQFRRQLGAVGELEYYDADYNQDVRDNQNLRYLAGMDVMFSRKLRTQFRFGFEERTFDQSVNDDSIRISVWEGSAEWAIRRRTSLGMEINRSFYELPSGPDPIDTGLYNVQDWIAARWNERWTDRLSTEVAIVHRKLDQQGSGIENTANQLMLSATYSVSNKLKLSFDTNITRERENFGGDFSDNSFTLRTDYAL